MKTGIRGVVALSLIYLLAACATTPPTAPATSAASASAADNCIGTVLPPSAGLHEISDNALLQAATGAPGKGALCKGKVFVADNEVTVYRVWDAAKPYTLYGSWWSFSLPAGPRDKYRLENDICPEWSALNRMSACKIKIGAKIAVGPGQSAQCASGTLLPPSPMNQVYIPNDGRNNVLYVEQCDDGADWPG